MKKISISLPKNKRTKIIEVNDSISREYHQRKNSISQSKINNYISLATHDQININDSLRKRNLPHLKSKVMADHIFSTPTSHKITKQTISEYKSSLPLKLKLKKNKEKIYKIKVPNSMDKNYLNFSENWKKQSMNRLRMNTEADKFFKNNIDKEDSINNLKSFNKTGIIKKTIDYDYSLLIKKLDNWDKDHCIKNNNDFLSLYDTLINYYKRNNLYEEENNLKFVDNMIKQKINYNKYKENKDYGVFKNKPKNKISKNMAKNNEVSDIDDQNKGTFLNSLIKNNLNKDTPKNKIDLYNKMMKERLNYENQLHNELVFVNNIIYNKKDIKKEKNIKLNSIFVEQDKLRHKYEQKKAKCMKEFYLKLEQINLEYNNLVYEKINESKNIQENKNTPEPLKKFDRKKTKQILNTEMKGLEFKHQNTISAINNEMKTEVDKIKKEFHTLYEEMRKKKDKLEYEMKIINDELNYYKNINEELQKEHQKYYLDILEKGNDCRKEGLVWVVKNLLELQINLEYHHFPKYLSHEQINYLKKLAMLNLEENELKIILKILKKKQKDTRLTQNIEYMNLFETMTNEQYSQFEAEKNRRNNIEKKEIKRYEEELLLIKKEIDKKFFKVYKDNEEALKLYLGKSLEEEKLQNLIFYIKKALYNSSNNNFLNANKASIIDAFIGKTKNKEMFELIINITNRLYEIEQKKESMIKKEKENFLESYKTNGNNSQSLNYVYNREMIKRCLFGNKIEL
jgi:hypothetical protein